jgi:hypothetical protein
MKLAYLLTDDGEVLSSFIKVDIALVNKVILKHVCTGTDLNKSDITIIHDDLPDFSLNKPFVHIIKVKHNDLTSIIYYKLVSEEFSMNKDYTTCSALYSENNIGSGPKLVFKAGLSVQRMKEIIIQEYRELLECSITDLDVTHYLINTSTSDRNGSFFRVAKDNEVIHRYKLLPLKHYIQ